MQCKAWATAHNSCCALVSTNTHHRCCQEPLTCCHAGPFQHHTSSNPKTLTQKNLTWKQVCLQVHQTPLLQHLSPSHTHKQRTLANNSAHNCNTAHTRQEPVTSSRCRCNECGARGLLSMSAKALVRPAAAT